MTRLILYLTPKFKNDIIKKMYLGVSGVAGAGKDLFYSIFKKEMEKRSMSVNRYAPADSLKKEVSDFTKEAYGIDALNCKGLDKELIRPFLVFHGTLKRNQTKEGESINQFLVGLNG